MPSKFAVNLFEVVKKWPKLFLSKMSTKLRFVPQINNFFSWRCHDPPLNQHGLMIREPTLIQWRVMTPSGKKAIDLRDKKGEILEKWKTHFRQKTHLIVVVVESCQNNSWW